MFYQKIKLINVKRVGGGVQDKDKELDLEEIEYYDYRTR